jgi:hypothetical protein
MRMELTDRFGTVVEVCDPDELVEVLKPGKRAQLQDLADGLVHDLAQVFGRGEDDARAVAIAELMRLQADEAAYERVAERKGLLPL